MVVVVVAASVEVAAPVAAVFVGSGVEAEAALAGVRFDQVEFVPGESEASADSVGAAAAAFDFAAAAVDVAAAVVAVAVAVPVVVAVASADIFAASAAIAEE